MFIAMDKVNFGEWLRKERESRDLSQSDLARLSGLHRQIINKTENGVSDPALKTYIALSNALNISLISILRIAGELPPGPDDKVNFDDWQHLLEKMTDAEREEFWRFGMMKIEMRQEKEKAARAGGFKAGKVVK